MTTNKKTKLYRIEDVALEENKEISNRETLRRKEQSENIRKLLRYMRRCSFELHKMSMQTLKGR